MQELSRSLKYLLKLECLLIYFVFQEIETVLNSAKSSVNDFMDYLYGQFQTTILNCQPLSSTYQTVMNFGCDGIFIHLVCDNILYYSISPVLFCQKSKYPTYQNGHDEISSKAGTQITETFQKINKYCFLKLTSYNALDHLFLGSVVDFIAEQVR